MKALVISCSLNPESRSHILAREAAGEMDSLGLEVSFHDLREIPLPLCDGDASNEDDNAQMLRQAVDEASVIILAVPIYVYDISAAAKNLIELTGKAWDGKTVGFLCAAGGKGSYMSVMGIANSLMLNFRCFIVPRFVYCTGDDFAGGEIVDVEVCERVKELCVTACKLAGVSGNGS